MSERDRILVGILVLLGGLMLVWRTHEQGIRVLGAAEIAGSLILIIASARRLKKRLS